MSEKSNQYGEGNYAATRQYNRATRRFVESGRVEQAARDAAPASLDEAVEMKHAELAALLRAKGASPQPCTSSPAAGPAASATPSPQAVRRSGATDAATRDHDHKDR